MKFAIYFKNSTQISPDDWSVFNEMKLFDENTTLKEVREWAVSKNKTTPMPQLSVNELESELPLDRKDASIEKYLTI